MICAIGLPSNREEEPNVLQLMSFHVRVIDLHSLVNGEHRSTFIIEAKSARHTYNPSLTLAIFLPVICQTEVN